MRARGVDGCRDATLRHVVRSRWPDDRSRRAARRSPALAARWEGRGRGWTGFAWCLGLRTFKRSTLDRRRAIMKTMRMAALRFLPLVLLSLGAAASSGQSAALVGSVFKDSARKTLPGAEVSIPDLDLTTRATDAGTFRLTNIAPGTYFVVARQIGYEPVSVYLTFADSQLVHANFLLIPHVVLLDTVVATGKKAFGLMRGFEERRAMGIGYFLTREDLEKRQTWRMTEV